MLRRISDANPGGLTDLWLDERGPAKKHFMGLFLLLPFSIVRLHPPNKQEQSICPCHTYECDTNIHLPAADTAPYALFHQHGAVHLRPMLFVDFEPLKSRLQSAVIAAHGLDADDHLFPIAIAIVPSITQDNPSCSYFFRMLTSCRCPPGTTVCASTGHEAFLAWLQRPDMVVFSDRSKMLIHGVSQHLSRATHV
jgi:hypothetical protein